MVIEFMNTKSLLRFFLSNAFAGVLSMSLALSLAACLNTHCYDKSNVPVVTIRDVAFINDIISVRGEIENYTSHDINIPDLGGKENGVIQTSYGDMEILVDNEWKFIGPWKDGVAFPIKMRQGEVLEFNFRSRMNPLYLRHACRIKFAENLISNKFYVQAKATTHEPTNTGTFDANSK